MRRKLIAFDFDGVIHSYDGGWQDGSVYGRLDLSGILLAQERGFATAIVTSRDVIQVATVVSDHPSLVVRADPRGEIVFWSGGDSGRELLVTNRKLAAVVLIDDRCVEHQFGQSWTDTLDSVKQLLERKKGTTLS